MWLAVMYTTTDQTVYTSTWQSSTKGQLQILFYHCWYKYVTFGHERHKHESVWRGRRVKFKQWKEESNIACATEHTCLLPWQLVAVNIDDTAGIIDSHMPTGNLKQCIMSRVGDLDFHENSVDLSSTNHSHPKLRGIPCHPVPAQAAPPWNAS